MLSLHIHSAFENVCSCQAMEELARKIGDGPSDTESDSDSDDADGDSNDEANVDGDSNDEANIDGDSNDEADLEYVRSDISMSATAVNNKDQQLKNGYCSSSSTVGFVEQDEKYAPSDDVEIDERSIPVFSFHSMESTGDSPIPPELVNLFQERQDLFWTLQNDILVHWYNNKKQSLGPHALPVAVAKGLYTMVYSCDDLILSNKASETLSLLYSECYMSKVSRRIHSVELKPC